MLKVRWFAGLVVAALALGAPQGADALTITLFPSKDNTLYEDATGQLSNGAGDHLFAGRTGIVTNAVRRGLIAFDLSGLRPDAVITGVELTMHLSRSNDLAGQSVALHRLLADWGEGASDAGLVFTGEEGFGAPAAAGDATWLHRFFDPANPALNLWNSPGGDFASTASASVLAGAVPLGGIDITWASTAGLVADVQGWVADPASNFGWLLLGNESQNTTTKRFDTRESAFVPRLEITFVPEPSSGLLLALALAGTLAARRRGGARR